MKTNYGHFMTKSLCVAALAGLAFAMPACDDDDDVSPSVDGGGDALGAGGTGGTPGTGGSTDGGTDAGGDALPAAPRGAANPPALGATIDRMGRAAIATALIGTFDGNEPTKKAVKDLYNKAPMSQWASFAPEIKKNLAILDALDGNCGNQFAANATAGMRYAFLAGALADDRLYINSASGTCGVYLGVEAGLVLGAATPAAVAASCGGRTPTDDVIERSYSVLAAGVLSGVDDTIASDADQALDLATFPWLAPPK